MSASEAFKRVKNLLETDRELRKMDPDYKCQFNESAMSGTAKGSKFTAEMQIRSEGSGSQIEIEVSLPLILTPVKGIVQSTLQKKIESVLA